MMNLSALFAALAVAATAGTETHYVGVSGDPVYPYRTPETAARFFADAIGAAEAGDTVFVLPGWYHRGSAEYVVLKDFVNFVGSGPDRTFFCPDMTVADGLLLSGFRFVDNKVTSGSVSSAIADCAFEGSRIECIGGGGKVLRLLRCEFVGLRSGRYVDTWGVRLSIQRCQFRATPPTYSLSGVSAGDGGFLRVDTCLFRGCDTAISLVDTQLVVSRTVFVDNGLGVNTGYLDVLISDCTFFKNRWAFTSATNDFRQQLRNCVLWGNEDGNVLEVPKGYPDDVYAPEIAFSDVEGGYPGRGNIDADPMFFLPSADEPDLHLCAFSPCVDAGDPFSDYSNEPEPNGGRVNMGAYGNTWEATTSELVDTDGDNIRDDWEMANFGSLARDGSGDADGDGLADGEEYRYFSDPDNPDTDGDGLLDGGEVYGFTLEDGHVVYSDFSCDPIVADTDNDGTPDGKEVSAGTSPLDPWDAFTIIKFWIEDNQIHVIHPVQPRHWYHLESSFWPNGPFGSLSADWQGRWGTLTHTFVADLNPHTHFFRVKARSF
jgi:hypothetical protein